MDNVNNSKISPEEFQYAQDAIKKLSDYFEAKVVGQNQLKFSYWCDHRRWTYSHRVCTGTCQDYSGQGNFGCG